MEYFIFGEVVTCIFSALLCFNVIASFSFSERRHRFFLYGGLGSFFATLFNICSIYCINNYKTLPFWLCTSFSTIYFLVLFLVPLSLSNYAADIAYSAQEKRNILFNLNYFVYIAYILIIILNIKTGWIFKYDAELGYVRGKLKNITYILTLYYASCCIFSILRNRKTMSRRMFIVFFTYPFLSSAIMALQFIFPKVIFTGAASFAALLLAYISIQSDMVDFDLITGLLTETRLEKNIEERTGVVFLVSIDNIDMIQNNMDLVEFNKLTISITRELSKIFERNSYRLSSDKFAGICNNITELKTKDLQFREFLDKINLNSRDILPYTLEYYTTGIEFSKIDKSYKFIKEVLLNLLKKAKEDGSNNIYIGDEAVLLHLERGRVISKILKRELNLNSEQFQVWFQPIYSLKDSKFMYMEALSRLQNTELGNISPQEFVEVAEQKGLIEQLGFIAFEKVCKFISENKDFVNAVSINFSVYQMTNPNVVQTVLETIEKFNLKPSNIIMEITESIFIDNYELVHKNMQQLAKAGIQFYLDDFGTGYSNLANVIALPFSTIKMDRSLVLMMEEKEKNQNFFYNLVETFKDAGLKILVEGIETAKQNDLVQQSGVDYIQGFLYSRPIPPEDCLELLRKQKHNS